MTQPVFDMKVRDLAERIYVDLLKGVVAISQSEVKMSADPKNVARVSFKLAASFHEVQDELNTANLPKNQDFKVNLSDIAAWNK
jgi:hypothetical protein